jgi:hypothetical protein
MAIKREQGAGKIIQEVQRIEDVLSRMFSEHSETDMEHHEKIYRAMEGISKEMSEVKERVFGSGRGDSVTERVNLVEAELRSEISVNKTFRTRIWQVFFVILPIGLALMGYMIEKMWDNYQAISHNKTSLDEIIRLDKETHAGMHQLHPELGPLYSPTPAVQNTPSSTRENKPPWAQ